MQADDVGRKTALKSFSTASFQLYCESGSFLGLKRQQAPSPVVVTLKCVSDWIA